MRFRCLTRLLRQALGDTRVVLVNGTHQPDKSPLELRWPWTATGFQSGSPENFDVMELAISRPGVKCSPFASNLHGLPLSLLWTMRD